MNTPTTLRWTSLMLSAALSLVSCESDDNNDSGPKTKAIFKITVDENDFRKIHLENTSTNATSYRWDFGDKSGTSTEANPTYTYTNLGAYTVTLTAINGSYEHPQTSVIQIKPALKDSDLNGGSSKVWKLRPAGGSFMVGPNPNNGEWWPGYDGSGNPNDISGGRPCLFNDEFIFKTDGVYEYDSKGDLWAEGYMGFTPGNDNQCKDEETIPEASAAWGSGIHKYKLENGKITVTGTGAFIALPKAKNDAEYAAGPPSDNGSVTYTIADYRVNGNVEALTLTIDIGPGYWTFVLIHEN